MFDRGKRIVEVVQQRFPLEVCSRLTKADRVIVQRLPIHQQQIPVRVFEAALQLVREVALHAADDRRRFTKSDFEFSFLPGARIQHSNFEDHGLFRNNERRSSMEAAYSMKMAVMPPQCLCLLHALSESNFDGLWPVYRRLIADTGPAPQSRSPQPVSNRCGWSG